MLEVCHGWSSAYTKLESNGQKTKGALSVESDKVACVVYMLCVDRTGSVGEMKTIQRVRRVIYQRWNFF